MSHLAMNLQSFYKDDENEEMEAQNPSVGIPGVHQPKRTRNNSINQDFT